MVLYSNITQRHTSSTTTTTTTTTPTTQSLEHQPNNMSSGNLPLATYHRAQSLGSGSYGSVITVYDDDGQEFALKLFEEDDDDDEVGMPLGALREISVLRLLRDQNEHPNIIAMHDVQTGFYDDGEEGGAGTEGYLAMSMPLFPLGSLTDSLSKLTAKAQKVTIAHGILTAVAHLHENSILHRDIKGDNILLLEGTAAYGNDVFLQPVLIDFSLAKVVDPNALIPGDPLKLPSVSETETTHTPSIGTPTYRAPEVLDEQEYSFPSDLWSVGVVLLELLRGRCLEATKDKGAIALIADSLQALPEDQPFPNLIRSLLETDPAKRLTARQALESPLFSKYGLKVDESITFRRLNIHKAVPFEDENDEEEKENDASSSKDSKSTTSHKTQKKKRVDPVLAKRFKAIQRVCTAMEWNHPVTAQAALCYSIQMSELCNVDDLDESPQALLDCVVLAHKFFERHLTDLKELPSLHSLFAKWDLDEYVDSESTLFMMMDFCLYPRQFLLLV